MSKAVRICQTASTRMLVARNTVHEYVLDRLSRASKIERMLMNCGMISWSKLLKRFVSKKTEKRRLITP